jgi:broad specificity phosphatase PhoE
MIENRGNRHLIYLVRHGETHENAARVEIGQRTHATLNPKGIKDAQSVAAWFKNNNPDITVIWSSPLHRSRTTAEYIARGIGASVYKRDELKEADMGAIDGLPIDQAKALYPEYYERRRTDNHYRAHAPWPGGGESYVDVHQRVTPIAEALEVVGYDIVVVGHRIVNKLLMGLLTGSPIEEVADYVQGHNEIIEVILPDKTVRSHTA